MRYIDNDYAVFPKKDTKRRPKIQLDRSDKKIAKGCGLAIKILKSDTPQHLCFEVIMFFPGTKRVRIFNKICVKIEPEWRDSSQLLEVAAEIHSGDLSRKEIFETFLIKSLFFIVEIKEDGLKFYISAHAPSKIQNYTDFSKSTTKHNNDTINWLTVKKSKKKKPE
ncbi:MAG: hypothetical protein WC087_02580 [Candidatus Paceibacterota bacterium]